MSNKTKDSVFLEIKCCGECPHLSSKQHHTADSFELCFKRTCSKKAKEIGIFDWHEKLDYIPKWCPLRKKP